LARATALLGLAFGLSVFGLDRSGGSVWAAAATQAGSTPPDNPFQDRGGESQAAASDEDVAGEESESDVSQEGESESTAEKGRDKDSEDEGDGGIRGLACIEGDATGGRRKGVQRRDFLKRRRFEIAGVGGYYASDALSSTYIYGGALAYFPSEDFGVELLVTRTPIRFRLEEPFSAFDLERHFQPGAAWQAIGSLLWSPIHAKFKFTDATIIHGDIFALAGFGRTFHESVLGLTWEAGFGLKLYISKYVTLRLDLRDFLLPQEVLGRGRTTNNITLMGGVSVWLL
jgi:outer membrane beta-barrel protein